MCRFKSVIILKDRIFVPDYDSHTDMLEELGIEDSRKNAEMIFVRAELHPTNCNVFSDIDTWKFHIDQDILPEWYVEEYDKKRVIQAVRKWAKNRIHIGKNNLTVSSGAGHYIKDCTNVSICGDATVKHIYGDATVKHIYGNATVGSICGNVTVEYICGNATVEYICDNATVEKICDDATVKYIWDNATVRYIYDNAAIISSAFAQWENKDKLILRGNATFKDSYTKTIYQSGDWKYVSVKE